MAFINFSTSPRFSGATLKNFTWYIFIIPESLFLDISPSHAQQEITIATDARAKSRGTELKDEEPADKINSEEYQKRSQTQ